MSANATILLLDCAPGTGIAGLVHHSLATAAGTHSAPHVVGRTSPAPSELTPLVRLVQACLGIVVLAAREPVEAARLLQALRSDDTDWPVMAVVPDSPAAAGPPGFSDVLRWPQEQAELPARFRRLVERSRHADPVTASLKAKLGLRRFIGSSPEVTAQLERLPLLAGCDATVLITGETGTGKEVLARLIHYLGHRSRKPFTAVNCGALPVELFENELFGHEPGAFTSAAQRQVGLLAETDGGTLFLDEIDTLPLAAQVKLLRFLQEKEYRPLGASRPRQADVRVIAASNVSLTEALAAGRFRQDLFYRLNVLSAALPPLRERREDIPLLARHFAEKYAAEFQRPLSSFDPNALLALGAHDWPGNVRELENVVQRAVLLARDGAISETDIQLPGATTRSTRPSSFKALKAGVVSVFESNFLKSLLAAHQGNVTLAAKAAQKNRRAFWELLRKHKIEPERFRQHE